MLLYGGSGHAKVIRDCLQANGEEVIGIFDDNPALIKLDETPVVGAYTSEYQGKECIILSIGDNTLRKNLANKVKHVFGKTIHPSVIFSPYSSIKEGSVVLQGAIVNAGTSIGKHCIVNTASIIEHDCQLDNFVHLSPNSTLCGGVLVGEGTHIGAGAIVIPNVTIGKWCIIGAGTVVTENIPDYSLVVGVPGKVIRNLAKPA